MARDPHYAPFKGAAAASPAPMRVLHRFTKPGHVAEIRERTVTAFAALEWLVFINGSLTESRMYHGARQAHYVGELRERVDVLVNDGWVEETPAAAVIN